MACHRCKGNVIKEIDRTKDTRTYRCSGCRFEWIKIVTKNPDVTRKPYSIFKKGLREVPGLRELGYKT